MSENPSPAPGRKRPAYLTVIYVVLGLLAFFVVTAGLGIWMFLRSETGQKIVATVGKSITLMQEASKAPGTEQLRAGGCSTAMVIPFEKMMEVIKELAPDANKEFKREELPGVDTMVVCQVSGNQSSAPTCDEVAHLYSAAVTAPDRFGVSVQGKKAAACEGTYARDGTFIEPLQRPRGSRPLPWDAPIERQ